MRLALFSDTFAPQMNGVSRTLGHLVNAVTQRGGEVRVFTTSDPRADPMPNVTRWPSIPCPRYPELRLSAVDHRRAVAALREYQPTLIHAATPFGLGMSARSAARTLGIPFVSSYHTSFAAYASFYGASRLEDLVWSALRLFHNGGDRTFCPTHAIRSDLEQRGFERVSVWGRGVDRERFSPLKRSRVMRENMEGPNGRIVVSYVGRIAREKGIGDVIDAANRLYGTDSRISFAFAGDGPHLDHCVRSAPPSCRFMGRLEGEDLAAFYASSDMFVFPSETDTFGNVLLEAMATGLPIVAAESAPSREIVGNGARWYEGGSGAQLALSLTSLAWNPEARRELGGASWARAANHSWDAVFDAMFLEYDAAILRHRQGPLMTAERGRPSSASSGLIPRIIASVGARSTVRTNSGLRPGVTPEPANTSGT